MLLFRVGGLAEGHFVYTSGDHGRTYLNKGRIYANPLEHEELARLAVEKILSRERWQKVDTIVGPVLGGMSLAQAIARQLSKHLGNGGPIWAAFAEPSADGRSHVFRRQFDQVITNYRVLVVDDILTTGETVRSVGRAVTAIGGKVLGTLVMFDRREIQQPIRDVVSLRALAHVPEESWPAENCPLCQKGLVLNTNLGRGAYQKKISER